MILSIFLVAACEADAPVSDFRGGDRPEYDRLVSAGDVGKLLESGGTILDVRLLEDYETNPVLIPRARYRDPERLAEWSSDLRTDGGPVVVYCVRGKWVSQKVAHYLDSQGIEAYVLDGGIEAWQAADNPASTHE